MVNDASGLPPRRVQGIEVFRLLPVVPDPVLPKEEPEPDYEYERWAAEIGGTFPEFIAYDWLEKEGYEPDIDFFFQSSKMGGRHMPGGAVVDFDFPSLLLAWRIQGEYWHVGNPAVEARDELQKLALTTIGYTVVDCYAQDVIQRTEWVLSNAIQGVQVRSYRDYSH